MRLRRDLVETRPTPDDVELVRHAFALARDADEREDRRPSDGTSELLRAAFGAAGVGAGLVIAVFTGRWFVSLPATGRLRVSCLVLLLFGSAWLLRACVRADWIDFVPPPRRGRFPRRLDDAQPRAPLGDGASGDVVAADVLSPQAGGRELPNRLEAGGMNRCRRGFHG